MKRTERYASRCFYALADSELSFSVGAGARRRGNAIAYTLDTQGVRTVWFARGPQFEPKMLWSSGSDDGQELSDLVISNDDRYVVYVRGGDHDENWPVPLEPDPALSAAQPQEQVWSAPVAGGAAKLLGDGDAPAIAPDGTRVAFIDRSGAVQIAPIDGSAPARRWFFDRGRDSELQWSPDGHALAFTSARTDHSFIGVYRNDATPLEFLAPTTSQDFMPRWAPDGASIAFIRAHGDGGAPVNPLNWNPQPWQIWVAQPGTSYAHEVWASGNGLRDSLPQSGHGPLLEWIAGDQLLFLSERDNWPHLYAVSSRRGDARLLTPGPFMVEDVSVSPDRSLVVYSANSGRTAEDGDRRHAFCLAIANVDCGSWNGDQIVRIGDNDAYSEFEPVSLAKDIVVADVASAQQPPLVELFTRQHFPRGLVGWPYGMRMLDSTDVPTSTFVTPKLVAFQADDGVKVYGQLFLLNGGGRHPAVIFVHGGPFRQMLLTWHYMDYYSNAYAVNQYLASRGFVVLSVNYRCGIGYGHDFNFPDRWGPTGAAEYQDVVAGARFLQHQGNVDPHRIGIWGGSYGGYLTALALARNSDIFKAGVDFHGVHDWSLDIDNPVWGITSQFKRYQQFDTRAMMKLAWESSPDSAIATWRSPVLLIQGDDDRNVEFHQMVDLVERLRPTRVRFEQMVIPNEIHGFLRYASWLAADGATVQYFSNHLGI